MDSLRSPQVLNRPASLSRADANRYSNPCIEWGSTILSPSTLPKFFITHSWSDNQFAQKFADDLKKCGLEGFFDVYSIQPGDNIPTRISEGLEACDVYIPILSHAAFQSPWCEWELNAAIHLRNTRGRNGRPKIVPVLIDDSQNKIPAILRPVAYIDFVDNYDKAFHALLSRGLGFDAALLSQLHGHIEESANASESTTVFVRMPYTNSNKFVLVFGIAVAVIAIIALLGWFAINADIISAIPTTIALPAAPTKVASPTRLAAPIVPTSAPAIANATSSTPPTSIPTTAPTLAPTALPTLPSTIANPLCPEPQSAGITFPANGNTVGGFVIIRGTVAAQPGAQPKRYSLFYRPGIIRDPIDSSADAQAPLSINQPNGTNVPIEVRYFEPYDGPMVDTVLGYWDTTKLSAGWYSLRLWFRYLSGDYKGCDVYVYVAR